MNADIRGKLSAIGRQAIDCNTATMTSMCNYVQVTQAYVG